MFHSVVKLMQLLKVFGVSRVHSICEHMHIVLLFTWVKMLYFIGTNIRVYEVRGCNEMSKMKRYP